MNFINKVKQFWNEYVQDAENIRHDQQNVMSQEEKIDQSIDESFPASDSPAHHSVRDDAPENK